ncbi:MAG TPA: histidine kinase [Humibacillus xanthopallidus]|nr:histidine kinase [Humibacillus xanthopallidus]
MTRRNRVFDITLAVVVGVLGQLEVWSGFASTRHQGPPWAQAGLYAATAVLLAFRRVNPLACQVAILAVSLVEFAAFGSPEGLGVLLPMMIAAYTTGRWLAPRQAWWGLVVAAAFWLAWSSLDPVNSPVTTQERLLTLFWLSPSLIAWLVGALVRLSALTNEQRRVNREQRASQAVAQERTRIARELHDVIGHSVSVMTVQASAVRRRLTEDQTAERRALETIEVVGREALAEMRRMVGVLRQSGEQAELEPSPGLEQLDRLATKFRTAGLPVELRVTGAVQALPPGLDLTAYRLVQEGLTNTLRHANHPHGAEVLIDYGPREIQLAVRDDGQDASLAERGEVGIGLVGMRERVAVYGGSLVARVRPEGGFEMIATLPLDAS